MIPLNKLFILYLIVMNLAGLLSMKIDKQRAINHQWRISEKKLFGISLLGGSLGSILGMLLFRHKTKHWYFVYGMPLILLIQIALLCVIGMIP